MASWCPPLFDEAPRRVTKRLFLYASDAVADMLRQKFRVARYVTEDYEYMAHMAWLIGGTSAGQALIREIDCVGNAWGKGDDNKTLSLIKVCTMHMISWWFRNIERRPEASALARRAAQESAASSMISVINKAMPDRETEASAMTRQDVSAFVSMDRQWNWESDRGAQPATYAGLLLARALEACGQRCVEWSRVIFPVESVEHLHGNGAVLEPHYLEDGNAFPKVLSCMDEGVRAVKRYYVMNIEGKVQPSEKIQEDPWKHRHRFR